MPPVTDPAPGAPGTNPDPNSNPGGSTQLPSTVQADLEAKWDADTKTYIESLRRESASHRTANKDLKSKITGLETDLTGMKQGLKTALGIKDDSEKPEEKLQLVVSENEMIKFRAAVLETALEHGVPKDGLDYFTFLVTQKANALNDGEELAQEQIAEIAKSVLKVHGKGPANTSVTGAAPPAPGGKDAVTLEQFTSMGITAKSKLYNDNPTLYTQLYEQAKRGKKL